MYSPTNQLAHVLTYYTPGLLELELALSSPCSLLDLGPLSSPQLARLRALQLGSRLPRVALVSQPAAQRRL